MENKTQTYLIYALAIVALVLLYKVFNWDSYRCRACKKLGSSKYLCRGCPEPFRQSSSPAVMHRNCKGSLGNKQGDCDRLGADCKREKAAKRKSIYC